MANKTEFNVPGRGYTWQLGFNWNRSEQYIETRALRAWAIPQAIFPKVMRWPFPHFSLVLGGAAQQGTLEAPTSFGSLHSPRLHRAKRGVFNLMGSPVQTSLVAKATTQRPVGGILGVYVGVQLSPQPLFHVEKRVPVGSGLVIARAQAQAETVRGLGEVTVRDVRLWMEWRPSADSSAAHSTSVRLEEPVPGTSRLKLKQAVDLSVSSRASTSLLMGCSLEMPNIFREPPPVTAPHMKRKNFTSKSVTNTNLDFLKLRVRGGKSLWPPHPSNSRDKARRKIAIVAGHWIDPAGQIGAPGERKFNMQVANTVTGQLRDLGWTVFRPELDVTQPDDWDHYLAWVRAKTRVGVPVLELHGQGMGAAVRRHGVLGVVGRKDAILCQELGHGFDWFPTNWQDLAIPRSGGAILEAFNTDQINGMNGLMRQLVADNLARRIVRCIEYADKRTVHGFKDGQRLVKDGWSTTGVPLRDTLASHVRHG